ncbi:MAG: PAS domain S-box protein [Pseudomonadota bacterium]|nr:PAS domain S-box protein [Chloroflexota bacterium]
MAKEQLVQQIDEPFDIKGKDQAELIRDLQVHQIELEMQNEELQQANEELLLEIAERKLVEDTLRANEEEYRIHFENVSDVIFLYDREFRILSISPSVERVLGYKPGEFIGKSFPELNILPSEYLEKAFSDGMRVFAGEVVLSSIYEVIAKDGTRKYGEFSNAPILREGQVVAAVSVARDITGRKLAESHLKEQIAELQRWHEVTLDREGRVLDLKREVNELLARAGEPPRYPSAESQNKKEE